MGRLRREAELQRKHLASLFMQAPMPIVILRGPDYVIELANEQACEVARRTREEIIGRPLSDVLPAGRIRSLRNLLDDVRNNGVTHVGKEVLVKIDRDDAGTPDDVYFNFVYAPMRDVDGATDGILVTAFDVTDEVLARKSMSDLREQAEAANRAKDEFLAMLGHELRTPLTSMVGWSNMLRMGLVEPAKQAEALQAIERAAKAQSQLIEDLLDISRISSGKLRLNVQPVDLIDVIQAAVAAVRPAADSSSIRLQVTLDQQVAPIAGDPDRLQQIVWNLISNAVKFTPEKGRIQIRLERVDSHVEITIADTGKGIAPEFLPHIFERFRQAESSFNRTHGGLGLGLSIVRSLVELHGGTITAQSPGENLGSTFVVRLPVMIVQDQKRSPLELLRFHPAAEADVAFECPPELDGLRVLIVEDDADGRRMLASILERCHCTTVAASSAAEACEVLETFRPNVLLSDIEMPVEDGYALIRRLRSNGISIPAAALTAHARTEDQVRALRAGFDMHVSKPIQPAELVTVIASLARRK
jgi:signal transduction histidine kinase